GDTRADGGDHRNGEKKPARGSGEAFRRPHFVIPLAAPWAKGLVAQATRRPPRPRSRRIGRVLRGFALPSAWRPWSRRLGGTARRGFPFAGVPPAPLPWRPTPCSALPMHKACRPWSGLADATDLLRLRRGS